MNAKRPTGDEKHAVRVTRTATKGGGATYHLTFTPESESVIQGGCAIEGMTADNWIASSLTIRLLCAAVALDDLDANRAPETVN